MHRPLNLDRNPDLLARLKAVRKDLPRVRCAIVHPCDPESIEGAHLAAKAGLIDPVLVGPRPKIERALGTAGLAPDAMPIVATEHSHAAAAEAVRMARAGEVSALMKGSLHTDELMEAAVAADGLRSGRRMSHVFVLDVPAYDRLLLVSDAAINIAPDLDTKRHIVQNAIDLAHALGIASPLVAILSAAETVNARIPSTVDAAALCKMADRGQITGGVLDGPLAFDNAISVEAATQKGIVSNVAGRADILVVPDLEAGNILAKQLSYFAGADSAGIVMGARCPIALTSRADPVQSRLASAALLALVSAHRSETAAVVS
ncbi:MAG TPA: bifunctional enoyl-CoA hydratase/phosphate acetyltransferase [Dongiaceae bacterium]|jgi:phosphotransacetylase|nr:bifunctional enoyl-CoA hydratase/phosphate acetyltransferase [Dongiaceae bacterium]